MLAAAFPLDAPFRIDQVTQAPEQRDEQGRPRRFWVPIYGEHEAGGHGSAGPGHHPGGAAPGSASLSPGMSGV